MEATSAGEALAARGYAVGAASGGPAGRRNCDGPMGASIVLVNSSRKPKSSADGEGDCPTKGKAVSSKMT